MKRFDDASLLELESLLAERAADVIAMPELRRACVLIPLVPAEGGWSILFQRRSELLRVHRGQIAFPGGSAEEGETLEEAALRETEEEVGVRSDQVRLIGRMDDLVTRTGFLVAVFVGIITPPVRYVSQVGEVNEIFEVPVDALLAPSNPEVRHLPYKGEQFPTYFYRYDEREIWGLTARMLKAFLDLVRLTV